MIFIHAILLLSVIMSQQFVNSLPFPVSSIQPSHRKNTGFQNSYDYSTSSEKVPHFRLIRSASNPDVLKENEDVKSRAGTKFSGLEPNIFDKYLRRSKDGRIVISSFNLPHPRSKRTIMFLVMKHAVKKFFKFFLLG